MCLVILRYMPVYLSTLTGLVKRKMNIHKFNFIIFASLLAASLFCTADKNEALVLATSSSAFFVWIADKNETLILTHTNYTGSATNYTGSATNWAQIVRVHSGKVLPL